MNLLSVTPHLNRWLPAWRAAAPVTIAQDFEDEAWEDGRLLPSPGLLFLLVALPLSLLPPLMVYFAGNTYGSRVFSSFSAPSWLRLAILLLLELLTIPLMASFTRRLGRFFEILVSPQNSYAIPVYGAIPLWLSSLALAVPSLIFNLCSGLLGLMLGAWITYRSVAQQLQIEDDTVTFLFSALIIVSGLPIWTTTVALILIP